MARRLCNTENRAAVACPPRSRSQSAYIPEEHGAVRGAIIAMSVTVLLARHQDASGSAGVQRLALEATLGALVYVGMLLIVDRKLVFEVRGILHDMFVSSRA